MSGSRRIAVPGYAWDRRQFLVAGSSALLWPSLAYAAKEAAEASIKFTSYPFTLGVASGDPLPDGFVIWTRLAPEPLTGGGMPSKNVDVSWQVALDEKMTQVVASGTSVATPELAHSVHVEVSGLEPSRWYFYRFVAGGEASRIGRAKTAPRAGDLPDRLRFAFASCQHFEQGLFTAYEHMAKEDLDLIAHLGDYIYEYAGKEKLVRKHVGQEIDSLDDYRNRHAQYRTDAFLQDCHAKCPWLVVWDDHEFDNDYANAISEEPNVQAAAFLERRARSYQAYYEHMPLRKAQFPQGPNMQLYRNVSFGRLVDFNLLDTRQYRDDQPGKGGNEPPPPEAFDPSRTLLGAEQEKWLLSRMQKSPATWNVLAQQIMMARVDRLPSKVIGYSMDQWPGYEANRQRLLKFFAEGRTRNPIVLGGDIHCNWVNDLQVDADQPSSPAVATEFVGTSISSGGDGSQARIETPVMLSENPFVKFFNNERGYVSCEVTPTEWKSHYRTVAYVTRPGAPLVTRKTFTVEEGKAGAQS